MGNILSLKDEETSLFSVNQIADGHQRGGLSCPVGADQGDNFTLIYVKVHPPQGGDVAYTRWMRACFSRSARRTLR